MKKQSQKTLLLTSMLVTSFAFIAWSGNTKKEVVKKHAGEVASNYKRLMNHLMGRKMIGINETKTLTVNKLSPAIECTTITYSVNESNGTYLDANLKISVDGVEKVFEFFTNASSFNVGCESNLSATIKKYGGFELEVECPVFIQWDYTGEYHLTITARNTSNQLVTLDSGVEYLGPSNTPNTALLNKTVWVPNGYSDVIISVFSLPYF
jgi:hypothetical protein